MTMGWETLPHNDMLAVMDHLANKGNNIGQFNLKTFKMGPKLKYKRSQTRIRV